VFNEEHALLASYTGTRLVSEQANWLLASVNRLIDTMHEFCEHVLSQPLAMRSRAIRVGLQPALIRLRSSVSSLNTICNLLQREASHGPLSIPPVLTTGTDARLGYRDNGIVERDNGIVE